MSGQHLSQVTRLPIQRKTTRLESGDETVNDLCWFTLVFSGNPKRLKLKLTNLHEWYLYYLDTSRMFYSWNILVKSNLSIIFHNLLK